MAHRARGLAHRRHLDRRLRVRRGQPADDLRADWDDEGRLLMATRDGAVKIIERRSGTWTQTWFHDLRDLTPDPTPSPSWARAW
ncbi:hypothetical protein AB0L53_40045 [Nonomuraea sp. NPDC052129]|uniref:hypothetical protein n=1 Tax=Nonomuraea sp. NPDC052129 TaxID=3154651 RepID=UPI00342EFCA7